MVPSYYSDQNLAGPSQWVSGSTSMQASIVLDQSGTTTYTNLDQIAGKVIVRCPKSADVSSIVVKLEGESRTRLMSPPGPQGERPKPQIEYHKILYKIQTVFPPGNVATVGKGSYTLPVGTHEYPFSFKIPFNNSCSTNNKQQPLMSSLEPARPAQFHVKKTLPPTLSGFPGEAQIRYFVKVTVNRQSVFKENPRSYAPFNFFPIEPPRPADSGSEVYARQKHKFETTSSDAPLKEKMKGVFSSGKKSSVPNAPTTPPGGQAPFFSIDARLPEPAILTCNRDVPLRLIFKKIGAFSDAVYLQSLQVALLGHTKVRAHEVHRTESNSWIITSKSNMNVPIGQASQAVNTETPLDDSLWKGVRLPNTVAPSFQTCNIERTYQLDIRIGLSYSGSARAGAGAGAAKPQSIVLPLRLNTLVYSGIAPPPEVLSRMAGTTPQRKAPPASTSSAAVTEKIRAERQQSDFGSNQVPPTPIDETGPAIPARPGAASAAPPEYEDAPPSYEDAVAGDAPAVSRDRRPEYAVAPPMEDTLLNGRDEKKGWSG